MDETDPRALAGLDEQGLLSTGHVLLVEDDEDDAVFVRDLLEAWPRLRVDVVATVAEASERLGDHTIECVLLDLGLPDAAGVEAIEHLLDHPSQPALVVLTGDTAEERGMEALGAGAQDYLVKGRIDAQALMRAIRYAVERKTSESSRQELALARARQAENARLQRGLLPAPLVEDPGLAIGTAYRPGSRRSLLGGDFYDVVQDAHGVVHAIVGDVCGHGPDEAALGVRLRMAWRTLILAGVDHDDLLPILDRVLVHERERPALFTSLAQVSVAAASGVATVRLAGHPPPILVSDGGARLLEECQGGALLGVRGAGHGWPARSVDLHGAWTLLLYTDGLYEGRIDDGPERLGLDGLLGMIATDASAGTDAGLDDLITRVEALNRGALTDDVAALALSADARGAVQQPQRNDAAAGV